MKKYIFFNPKLFLVILTLLFIKDINAQHPTVCGMINDENEATVLNLGIDDIDFFPSETCGTPLVMNCRFVFFTRNDGTGVFPENDLFTLDVLDEVVRRANNDRWANIRDQTGCSPQDDYPVDANFRMKVDYDYIADEEAWDYHAQAVQLNTYGLATFCPDLIMANNTWPHLRDVIIAYNNQYPNSFNFFFIEDGNLIRTVEEHLANGTTPQGEYTDGVSIFTGCSRLPRDYYSNTDQFVIMANFYTDWFARTHFGVQFFPNNSDVGNATLAQWHLDEQSGAIVHELGHSIVEQAIVHEDFGCADNIMGANSGPYSQHLVPLQLTRLHRNLMTSNNHRYISCEDITETTCDLVITQDETIDYPISIFGDLIIEENVTLTIHSEMYFSEKSSIDLKEKAKLIVDGGLLTSGCGDKWHGIRVTGGNEDFDVRLVEITDNTFNDIEKHSIVTEKGSFTIEGNVFYSNENDILFANISVGVASLIKNNDFYANNTGIRALGTTFDQNVIEENRFYTGLYDIWMEGDNNYRIFKNDMSAFVGVVSIN